MIGILQRRKEFAVCGFLFISFLVGIFRFDQVEQSRPDLYSFYGKPQELVGIIVEEPSRSQAAQRMKIDVTLEDTRFLALVTTRKYPKYKIGDELKIKGLLERPENYSDFDYVSYLARDDIFSVMSFPLMEKVSEGKGNKLKLALSKIKHAFEEKIDQVLPEPHAAFLKGLLLGERESLPEDLVENFKRTGTTHIVALSGYNITLVGSFIIGALLFLTVPFRVSFWIAVTAITLFVILTGASPSVVRAGIMGILVLIARQEGRIYHMTNALAFAAAVMIFHNPRVLRFDAAFQLSFLATVGLVYLAPYMERWLDGFFSRLGLRRFRFGLERKGSYADEQKLFPFRRIFIETLSAQIMVLPLLIYLFGRVSIISPITNVLVLIAVPYSMAAGFLAGALGFLWEPLGRIFGWATWVLLEYEILAIEFFAKAPLASVKLGTWGSIMLAALYILIFFKLKINKSTVDGKKF